MLLQDNIKVRQSGEIMVGIAPQLLVTTGGDESQLIQMDRFEECLFVIMHGVAMAGLGTVYQVWETTAVSGADGSSSSSQLAGKSWVLGSATGTATTSKVGLISVRANDLTDGKDVIKIVSVATGSANSSTTACVIAVRGGAKYLESGMLTDCTN